jgi:hypothetical protein
MRSLFLGVAALFIATASAQAQVCPVVGEGAERLKLVEGFQPDPSRHKVTAGGTLNLGNCTSVVGHGYVTRLPDFVVNYKSTAGGASAATLTFRIESQADTVLLVNDPQERWHFNDDDGNRLNAKVSFKRAASGRYDIWVGSFNSGEVPPANLIITEVE